MNPPLAATPKERATAWARNVLDNPDQYLIVDTETTGLWQDDVVVHFAVMNLQREMEINNYIRPTKRIKMHKEAQQIHGIGLSDLHGEQPFESYLERFSELAEGKIVLIFNEEFHVRMIQQTCESDGIAEKMPILRAECVQMRYRDYIGETFPRLPGRTNTGRGDCEAVLSLIERMAEQPAFQPEQQPAPQMEQPAAVEKYIPWIFGAVVGGLALYFLWKYVVLLAVLCGLAFFSMLKKR